MNKVAVKETAFFIIFFLRAVKNKKPTKNNKINNAQGLIESISPKVIDCNITIFYFLNFIIF
ncbi:hypothetical protein DRN98_10215 [Methanosarcinales archaeon]|nr:MAG: hypothetical protein DRN98_10215 [Methanosarcinales archaeon]